MVVVVVVVMMMMMMMMTMMAHSTNRGGHLGLAVGRVLPGQGLHAIPKRPHLGVAIVRVVREVLVTDALGGRPPVAVAY
jgi:hypothetical protein